MTTVERVSKFNPRLLEAFKRMVLGINVEITEECRKEWNKESLGRWFFIKAINEDETLCLCSNNHYIYDNVRLSDIKFIQS